MKYKLFLNLAEIDNSNQLFLQENLSEEIKYSFENRTFNEDFIFVHCNKKIGRKD